MTGSAERPANRPPPPLVSVGVPVYNGAEFLGACLESLLAQTYQHVEIIVSDNASTDATPRIIAEYARRDSRIRFTRADRNRGVAWNHNHILGLATGAYFKWCGADDVFDPRFLKVCVAALLPRPDAILAFPRTIVIDGEGRPIARTTDHLPMESPDPVVRFGCVQSALPVTQNLFYGVMRTQALRQVRQVGAFLAADRCLLAELSLLGPFIEVPEFLMYRRVHAENARSRPDEQRLYKPSDLAAFRTRELHVLGRHLTAVARAPVSTETKLRLIGRIARWVGARHRAITGEALDVLKVTVRRLLLRLPSVLALLGGISRIGRPTSS